MMQFGSVQWFDDDSTVVLHEQNIIIYFRHVLLYTDEMLFGSDTVLVVDRRPTAIHLFHYYYYYYKICVRIAVILSTNKR